MGEISGLRSQFLEFSAGLGVSSLTGGIGTKLSSSIASLLSRRIGVLPSIALQAFLGGLSAAGGQNISGRALNLNQSEQDSSRAFAVFLTGALTAAANAVVKNKNLTPAFAEGRLLLRAAEVLTGSHRAKNWAGYLQEAGINFGMAFGEDVIGSGLGDGFSWQRSLFTGIQAAGMGHVVSHVTRSGSHFEPRLGSKAGRDGLVIQRKNLRPDEDPVLVSVNGRWVGIDVNKAIRSEDGVFHVHSGNQKGLLVVKPKGDDSPVTFIRQYSGDQKASLHVIQSHGEGYKVVSIPDVKGLLKQNNTNLISLGSVTVKIDGRDFVSNGHSLVDVTEMNRGAFEERVDLSGGVTGSVYAVVKDPVNNSRSRLFRLAPREIAEHNGQSFFVSRGGNPQIHETTYGQIHFLSDINGYPVSYAHLNDPELVLISNSHITDQTPPFIIPGQVVTNSPKYRIPTDDIFVVVDGQIHQVMKPSRVDSLGSTVVGKNGMMRQVTLKSEGSLELNVPEDGQSWPKVFDSPGFSQTPLYGNAYPHDRSQYTVGGRVVPITGVAGDTVLIGEVRYTIRPISYGEGSEALYLDKVVS